MENTTKAETKRRGGTPIIECPRCGGTGIYFNFGPCFRCEGSGKCHDIPAFLKPKPEASKPFVVMARLKNGNYEAIRHSTREQAERHINALSGRRIAGLLITAEEMNLGWEVTGYGTWRPK